MPRSKPPTPTRPRKPSPRGLSRFRRSETARLLKGVVDAGLSVRGLEADPASGVVRVLVESGRDEPRETSPLEQWKATRGQS